ncbi:MAG: TatD family hydrolase [Colwellia sp.]|nr:TatD family hydrolase [Colwellia sp.]
MKFTDSHCHLDFIEFSTHCSTLLHQCDANNINRIIVPAVNPEHWQRVLSLPEKAVNTSVKISCCLGIHPWFLILEDNLSSKKLLLKKSSAKNLSLTFNEQRLRRAIIDNENNENENNLVGIGECGIDVFKAKKNTDNEQALAENISLQQNFFDMQLRIAAESNLPVIAHHCQSHHLILPLLKRHKLAKAGVIHAFYGSYQQAKDYIDLGFKLGVGGTITYPRAKKTLDAIKRVPLTSLVIETDAPAMPPIDQQGQINSPLNLKQIFQSLTNIRSESAEEIAEQLEQNVDHVFYIK